MARRGDYVRFINKLRRQGMTSKEAAAEYRRMKSPQGEDPREAKKASSLDAPKTRRNYVRRAKAKPQTADELVQIAQRSADALRDEIDALDKQRTKLVAELATFEAIGKAIIPYAKEKVEQAESWCSTPEANNPSTHEDEGDVTDDLPSMHEDDIDDSRVASGLEPLSTDDDGEYIPPKRKGIPKRTYNPDDEQGD